MHRGSGIVKIQSVIEALANPRTGDWIALDIDEVLLLTALDKYEDLATLTQNELVDAINVLHERGIRVFGITARKSKFKDETIRQLEEAGVKLDYVLHAPNEKDANGIKRSTKGKVLREHLESSEIKPKRLCVVDDLPEQLESVIEALKDYTIPLVCYHFDRPHKQAITLRHSKKAFPKTLDGFSVGKSLGGGTESTFLLERPSISRHKSRYNKLVLKLGAHDYAIKIEILCNALYRVMGVNVPDIQVYNTLPTQVAKKLDKLTTQYGIFSVSQYIESGDYKNAEELIIADARKHFVAHALLGNIDVAKRDNFIIDNNGKVFLIDAGANFIYRSLGKFRKERHSSLTEIESLTNADKNENGAKWFGEISKDEIKAQVIALSKKIKKLERTIWYVSNQLQLDSELREDFISGFAERLDGLIERYCPEMRAYPNPDKVPDKDQTAAGILTLCLLGGEYHVLLGKRVRHNYFANLGGKSDEDDRNLAETALREVREESGSLLKYTEQALLDAPFHDLMYQGENGKHFSYRMYLAEHDWVDIDGLLEEGDGEHTEYCWVPLANLLSAAKGNEGALAIEIYEPLLCMLRQAPVNKNLERLLAGEAMLSTHTSSVARPSSSFDFKTRAINTPARFKQGVAEVAVSKSSVISELKKKRGKIVTPLHRRAGLSQSEIHMKLLLGEEYQEGEIRKNVEKIIMLHFIHKLPDNDVREDLINQLTELVASENVDDSKIHFIHAVNDKIDFIYDLNSEIFALLRSSPDWIALRMSSDKFHYFTNIAEFISHYTINGDIDNRVGDYMAHAISANLFVFGNHHRDTSCSLDYLIDNETSTDLSLTEVLSKYFKTFELRKQDIKALKEVYKKHKKDSGGVLYQLSVGNEDVRNYSYPAGQLGILNYLGDQKDICSILDQLRREVEAGQYQNKEYVLNLQARLLVKPSMVMSARRIMLKTTNSQVDKDAYKHDLKVVAETIVKSMLRGANSTNAVAIRRDAPVVKRVQEQHQLHGLPTSQVTTQRYLLKCLLSDNMDMVKKILINNPELREQSIEYKRHVNFLKKKHQNLFDELALDGVSSITPVHMMSCLSGESDSDNNKMFDASVLDEVYGEGWPAILANHGGSFNSLCAFMKSVPGDRQLMFVKCISDHIKTCEDLICVIDNVLYAEDYLDIIKWHVDKISISEIGKVIHKQKSKDRYEFALFYIDKYNINNLIDVLAVVNQSDILKDNLLNLSVSLILDFDHLLMALDELSVSKQELLIKTINNTKSDIMFSGDVRKVFDKLVCYRSFDLSENALWRDVRPRNKFIAEFISDNKNLDKLLDNFNRHVTNLSDLDELLNCLPSSIRLRVIELVNILRFINSNITIIQFFSVLDLMEAEDKESYLNSISQHDKSELFKFLNSKINNFDELSCVLNGLPKEMRYQFVTSIDKKCLLSYLTLPSQFLRVCHLISLADKNNLEQYLDVFYVNKRIEVQLSISYLNEVLSKSKAPEDQSSMARAFINAVKQAICSDCTYDEQSNMSDKLRLVAAVIDDPRQLPTLIASIHDKPLTHGKPRMIRMVTGALLAFVGVSLCIASVAALITTGGFSTPLSICGVSMGIELMVTAMAMVGLVGVGMSITGGFFAYSGHKQCAVLALDNFTTSMGSMPTQLANG